ncbi:peroxisomal targeting signal 1 receptor [Anabrus simplex]|uniref:peroxisomal targeting signal 1 receptor n=1 Tax=Anabrus simplex TaxID=316456 RepID=UPI0035A28B58
MALQDLVGSECGRSHPLTQLTSHFLLDQAHEERGLCRPSSSQEADELVQEYLEEVYGPKARSFCMDSLFQEMTQIESGEFPQVPTPRGPTAADEPDLEAVGSTWVQEYLGSRKPFNEEYHEEEVWRTSYKPEISRIQSTFHHGFDSIWTPDHFQTDERNIDIDENWLQESEADEERQGSLQELAKMFLNSVDDPKLKGSKFMKFMQQVGNGDISISGGKVMEHTSSELGDGNISNIIEEVSESTSKDNGIFCTTTVENSSVTPSESSSRPRAGRCVCRPHRAWPRLHVLRQVPAGCPQPCARDRARRTSGCRCYCSSRPWPWTVMNTSWINMTSLLY